MQFEEEVHIDAPAERVFALYSDVDNWTSWDPDVKSSSIDGSFVTGAKGTLTPTNGPKANISFVEVVPDRSFTVKSKLPLCAMKFEHEISTKGPSSVSVAHPVSFTGLLSTLFGRLVGSQIRKGLPNTLAGLKKAAEAGG